MQVAKPFREVSFVYGGLTRFLVFKDADIAYVFISNDHLFVYLHDHVDRGDIPLTLVHGSGFYNVSSKWASFTLYFRYCESIVGGGLRFYIDHERNKQERVGKIKC